MGEKLMNIEKLKKDERVTKLLDINYNFFSMLLVTYLLLLLVETIWTDSVSTFLNLNYFLLILMISGAISVLTREEEKIKKIILTKKDFFFIAALGIAGMLIIWYKIKDIGNLAYVISIIAGALIILISLLLNEEDEKDG